MVDKPKKQTKTGFVLSLPTSMSAKEVIAKAKAAGMTLTDKTIYAVRYEARTKGKKHVGAARKAVAGRVKKAGNAVHDLEATFHRLVLNVGLTRAKALLNDVENKLNAFISRG